MIVFTAIPTALQSMPAAIYTSVAGPAPDNIALVGAGYAIGALLQPLPLTIAVEGEAATSGPPAVLPAVTLGVADLPARAGARRRGGRR